MLKKLNNVRMFNRYLHTCLKDHLSVAEALHMYEDSLTILGQDIYSDQYQLHILPCTIYLKDLCPPPPKKK